MRTITYRGIGSTYVMDDTVFPRGTKVMVSDEWALAHDLGPEFRQHETLVTDMRPSRIVYHADGTPMDITVIIPQFRTPKLIRDAVTSVRRFYPDVPMIIVDDGSRDESTDVVMDLADGDPNTTALILYRNGGHGPAVHAGIMAATTRRVFVMDSDCIVNQGGFLERMENRMIEAGFYAIGVLYHRDWSHDYWYLSCVASLYDRDVYLTLPPFRHSGDPMDANMAEARRVGASVEGFPIFDYIDHVEEGTRKPYAERWDLTGVAGCRILIYGNSYISEVCAKALMADGYNIVGYVANRATPTVPGVMPVPEATPDALHDLKLSIQFDHKIALDRRPGFNLHTGLLPDFGGTDILYHTLRRGERSQGLTFHQMTDLFDQGPILSKISYPVIERDDMVSLYQRMATIAPGFLLSCMEILDSVGLDNVVGCSVYPPTLYRRGDIDPADAEIYRETPGRLREIFERNV